MSFSNKIILVQKCFTKIFKSNKKKVQNHFTTKNINYMITNSKYIHGYSFFFNSSHEFDELNTQDFQALNQTNSFIFGRKKCKHEAY